MISASYLYQLEIKIQTKNNSQHYTKQFVILT